MTAGPGSEVLGGELLGGELLVVGLPGTILEAATRRLLERVHPGGVILLPRNIEAEGQLLELVAAVRRAVPEVLLYLDAEGGRVDRLRHIAGAAPAGAELAGREPALAERAGRWVGHALAACGFQVDLAPVVDLDRGRRDNALDGRYLGRRPRAVVARAGAFLRGLHSAGVGGCLKHFPGLGGAGEDTHDRGSRVDLGAAELATDLEPFRRLATRAGALMAGHACYPAYDASGRPATLSPSVAGDLLRRRLGFTGVLLSDDLDMHALDPWGSLAERAEAALVAGCDVLCICHSLEAAPAVVERLAAPRLAERRRQARDRVERYRRHLAGLRDRRRRYRLETVRRRLAAVRQAALAPRA